MNQINQHKRGRIAAACGLALFGSVLLAQAQPAPPPTGSSAKAKAAAPRAPASAASAAKAKDIVLDAPSAAVQPQAGGALVPTPGAQSQVTPALAELPPRGTSAAQDTAIAGALAELALDLMRQQSKTSGDAQVNSVVSSVSLASAMGMVHAGAVGAGAREIAGLLGAPSAGDRNFTVRFPSLLGRLAASGAKTGAYVMANRVWLDKAVVTEVPTSYAALVSQRFKADGAVVPFAQAPAARDIINGWVSEKTSKRIPELMPDGSITPTTKMVVTNAIYFKSKWAQPFDAAQTVPKPFHLAPGGSKPVPMMVDERQVRMGTVDNVTVIELPFAGNEFTLLVGMPPAGHTLNAFEEDLDGLELAGWSSQLKPVTCRLELPKFTIAPVSRSLKPALQAMGVKTVFGPEADLSGMLGKAGKGVQLDNVYQSATIIIDEQGGEAAAATGATGVSKSFSMPAPPCAVDRPFIFAVVHKGSGAPLFVGKVADPTRQ